MEEKIKKILTLISCFLVNILSAMHLLWGVINNYVLSFYWNKYNDHISIDTINVVNPLGSIGFLLGVTVSMKLAKKIGFKYYLTFFGIVISFTFAFAIYIESLIAFIFVYSIVIAACHGFTYVIPIYCASKLYYSKKGLISGILLTGFGISESLVGILFSKIINPNNIKAEQLDNSEIFPISVTDNLHKTYLIIGGILFILSIMIFLLFNVDGLERDSIPYNEEDDLEITQNNRNLSEVTIPEEKAIIKDSKIHKYPSFYLLPLMIFCSTSFSYGFSTNFKNIGLKYIGDDSFVSTWGSISLFVGALIRIPFGKLMDMINFEYIYSIILALELFLSLAFPFMVNDKFLFILYLFGSMISLSSHYAIFPPYCLQIYGLENGAKAYTFVLWGMILSSFNQFLIYHFFREKFGYTGVNRIFCCFIVVSVVLTIFNTYILRRHTKNVKKSLLEKNKN